MARKRREPGWRGYLAAWDRQQEEFNPWRERRFEVMFDATRSNVRSGNGRRLDTSAVR